MSIKTWFAEHLNPKHWTVKTRVVVASVTALALAGGGVGVAFALRSPAAPMASPSATPTATASPTPTPTPTPTPEPVSVQRTALAEGVVNGWTLAGETELAGVAPQVGDAAHGEIALEIDAPVVREPRIAARTTVSVRPNSDYRLTASVRVLESLPVDTPASLHVGASSVPLPDLDARWQTVQLDYRTGGGETQTEISVQVNAAVRGLSIDAVSLHDNTGVEVVLNGSFEDVQADWGIRNRALILQKRTAALAVRMPPGDAAWRATRMDGMEVARGVAPVRGALSAIPLQGLGQGYFNVTVTDAAGGTVTTPVAIVDMPTRHVPVDRRIGVQIHAQKDFSVGAPYAAAAAGLGMMRTDDAWQVTERNAGVYTFNPDFDVAFAEASALGIDRLLITGRTNPLYDGYQTPYTEAGIAAYGRYAAALAQHFDLTAIEIYNEFNIESFNKGPCGRNAGCYAPLLESAYNAIEAVSPGLPVVGGVTGNYYPSWFEELWQSGGLNHLDIVSFHPYQVYGAPEGLADIIGDARHRMGRFGTPKPIWLTELGWTTKTGDVSFEQQAEMVIRSQVTALASGVDRFLWYNLINDGSRREMHEENFGQFTQKLPGVYAFPPKPAAFTQALFINSLAGKTFSAYDDLGIDGVRSAVFSGDGESVRYAWATKGQPNVQYAASGPLRVTTAHGVETLIEPVDGQVTVTLSSTPVIITGQLE